MQTHEIPRAEWFNFFNSFSREHVGGLVTMEVLGNDVGAQVEAEDLPLVGVSAEPQGDTVWVALAKAPDDHLTHGVQRVVRVRMEKSDDGSDQALQIESEDGVRTLVRLKTS